VWEEGRVLGPELLAGYAIAYLVRKARRIGRAADAEVDHALDAGMDRLHQLVSEQLGVDPSLAKLQEEAAEGTENPRTEQRVRLAIEEAVEGDRGFAAELDRIVAELQAQTPGSAAAGEHGLAAGRDVNIQASGGGVAGGVIHGSISTHPQEPDQA
jgi:hypothetical protein